MRPITRTLGTLSAAALLLAACGGSSPTTAPTTAATTPSATTPAAATTAPAATAAAKLCEDVTQAGAVTEVEAGVADFTWGPVAAKVGQVITWKNSDTAPHGVQTDDSGCKMNGSIAANQTRSLVFNEAGSFPFFCFVHPNMTGTITIT